MKKYLKENKNKLLVILYCFIVSFVILLFTSKNSYLYPFNDWVDANAFFTVGKGMFKGVVPYKDIFEQKGPFLYLIYGIGSIFSYTSFVGVFILEVICWTIGLYFLYKLLRLFISTKSSLIIIPLFTSIICTTYAFSHGGSAEEFMLPLFMITLYYFFKHFKVRKLTKKEMFINGVVAGLVLLTKYTLLGFWIGFTFSIFIDYVIDKDYKKSIIYPLILLGGMISALIPFLIYFGINNALGDFFKNYFIINITSYGESVGILTKLKLLITGFAKTITKNVIALIIILVMLLTLWKLEINKRSKWLFLITMFITIFFVFFGLKFYRYYVLFILFFTIIGLLSIFNLFDRHVEKISTKKYTIMLVLMLICVGVFSFNFANFKDYRNKDIKDLFQYEYSSIINEDTDKTLVNMGHVDCGVFTIAGLLPSTYFFEHQNFSYENFPDNDDAFKDYIKNKQTNYIVYFKRINLEKLKQKEPELFENYELIKVREQEFEGYLFHAYLFKRKVEI